METALHELEGCLRELTLTLSAEELHPHFEKAYAKLRPTLALPGFRKGHVPRRIMESMLGESVEREALGDVANEEFQNYVRTNHLSPIGAPHVTHLEFTRGQPAAITIRYEEKPVVPSADYTHLAVERPVHEVTDADVEAEIDRQRYLEADTTVVDRVEGDDMLVSYVLQDVDAATKAPILGTRGTEQRAYLRRPSVAPEFRERCYNTRVGDSFLLEMPVDDAEDPGATQERLVTVTRIERVELPPLTDEFAARATDGKAASVDAFRTLVRQEMHRQWDERLRRALRDRLAEAYVARHVFPVPEALVHEMLHSLEEGYARQDVPTGAPEVRDALHATAEWQARWALVREAFFAAQHLEVEEADMAASVAQDHERLGVDVERLREFYRTNEQFREQTLMRKMFAMLEAAADITDRPV